jgi:hypothetical protein
MKIMKSFILLSILGAALVGCSTESENTTQPVTEQKSDVTEQQPADKQESAEQSKDEKKVEAKEPEQKVEEQAPVKEEESKEETKQIDWQAQLKDIAKSEGTPTEKATNIELLARQYAKTVAADEVSEFANYIVSEYKDKNYLHDINDSTYMLTNIFKSVVVEKYYDDEALQPIDKFAFDFYQNTKYTYRGADAVDSDSVKSNENQMDKALKEIG